MLDVLILAAGRGQRLQPLSDSTPKALVQVGEHTLVEHHLVRLGAQGFNNVVINLAWLGQQIRDYLGDGERFGVRIAYSDEPEGALETGGGILNALKLIESDPFIVVNADVLCDFDFASLQIAERYAMHLVLVPNPQHHVHGDFALADEDAQPGRLLNAADELSNWTYSGIGCFRREVFDGFQPGRFPLLSVIKRAITDNNASAEIHDGQWLDVGTPERLEHARQVLSDMD